MSPRFPTPGMSVRSTTFTAHPPRRRQRPAPTARAQSRRDHRPGRSRSTPPGPARPQSSAHEGTPRPPAPPRPLAAPTRPLARGPLREGQKRQLPSRFDCQGDFTLVLGTVARHPAGPDLSPIGHELAQQVHVLVIDPSSVFLAEDADLLLRAPTGLLRDAPGTSVSIIVPRHLKRLLVVGCECLSRGLGGGCEAGRGEAPRPPPPQAPPSEGPRLSFLTTCAVAQRRLGPSSSATTSIFDRLSPSAVSQLRCSSRPSDNQPR